MARKSRENSRKELNYKWIAIIIAILVVAYIISTNLLTIIIATFGTAILALVIIIVGAYFILPRLGLAGLAALFSLGKDKK